MRLIPTARETLEKRLKTMGVDQHSDLDPKTPLHTVSTQYSMPTKDTLVPAILANAPLACTTEETFPSDNPEDPTAVTPLPVAYGENWRGTDPSAECSHQEPAHRGEESTSSHRGIRAAGASERQGPSKERNGRAVDADVEQCRHANHATVSRQTASQGAARSHLSKELKGGGGL
jgi:hypothetical protein